MAKVAIKSEKLTPFGRIFSIMEQFDSMLSPIIYQTLGQRCRSIIGYQYSEIIRPLMSVHFCGGSCPEDVPSHLMRHLSYHPTLRTCSSDTILRAKGNCQWDREALHALLHPRQQMHSYQRLRLVNKRHRRILQQAWGQRAYIRWYEQPIRLEQAPQFIHGGEYSLSSAYCIDTQFL